MSLKALVRYAQVFGGPKGAGEFTISVNGDRLESIKFDQDAPGESNIDFSKQVNKWYEDNGDGEASIEITLEIDNYKYNDQNSGFKVSTLVEAEFVDSLPSSNEDIKNLEFTIDAPAAETSTFGSIQSQKITVKNTSEKPQQMTVA